MIHFRVTGALVRRALAALVVGVLACPVAGLAQAPAGQPAAVANPAAEQLKKKFSARLAEIAGRVDGVMSFTIVDLTNGDRFSALEQLVAPTASTIKLTVLYELVKQAEEGRLKLDAAKPLDRAKAVEGSGVLYALGTPTLSLRDHATLMVVLSDNTATNVLIDEVGMDAVNSRMRGLGLAGTRLRRHMMDGAAARRGDENVSTSSDIARLLEAFYRGQGLAPASRDEALRILKIRNESKVTPLVRGVPENVDVASKPGELEGVRVDAGIVWAAKRPYLFSAMTTYLQDDGAGAKAIEEMSRVAYEYFSRLGAGTDYGRQIGR